MNKPSIAIGFLLLYFRGFSWAGCGGLEGQALKDCLGSESKMRQEYMAQERSAGQVIGHFLLKESGSKTARDNAEVDVFPAYEGQAVYIDFSVARSGSNERLGLVTPAVQKDSDTVGFAFIDQWGNKGEGTFRVRGSEAELRLRLIKKSESAKRGAALYGAYHLSRENDNWKSDRHPWSLGRPK